MEAYKFFTQFEKDLQKFQTDLISGKFVRQISRQIIKYVYRDINEIFELGVERYYNSYTPIFYHRQYALYKAYKITYRGTKIFWKVGEEFMPDVHRVDNSYIFDYMFEQGYHGGAVGANAFGELLWRTPHPSQGTPAYRAWGYPAVQTSSPSDNIEEMLNAYQNSGKIESYVPQAFASVKSKYALFRNYGI